MRVLVTGADGFVGKNLVAALNNLKNGNDRRFSDVVIDDVYSYDLSSSPDDLDLYCRSADFIYNFAGVNRPKYAAEFKRGNSDFTGGLLSVLSAHGNRCPVMLASSVQASLVGRYADGEYGKSKRRAEDIVFEYGKQSGAEVYVYRFPNLFGKWCKPNYNSVIATFCHNIARGLPIQISDENIELELAYIDDVVDAMLGLLKGKARRCDYRGADAVENAHGRFCFVPISYRATLGEIVGLLDKFAEQPRSLVMPEIPSGSFAKKLYSTYLSYLPKEKVAFPLKMNTDDRGSFTELVKTQNCGQFSVNISKPGIVKGEHWHNSKWEFFIVVSGHALIQQRMIGTDEIIEFEVDGDNIQAVHMLPGYTHNIVNLSETEDLVTLMWANEQFDPFAPDTYAEKVVKK